MANPTVTGASSPEYADKMALLFPEPGKKTSLGAQLLYGLIDFGAKVLPS